MHDHVSEVGREVRGTTPKGRQHIPRLYHALRLGARASIYVFLCVCAGVCVYVCVCVGLSIRS